LLRFVESGWADDLRTLSVSHSNIDEAAAKALITLPRLRGLNTQWSNLTPGVPALFASRWP
jgi:hypothetical protein